MTTLLPTDLPRDTQFAAQRDPLRATRVGRDLFALLSNMDDLVALELPVSDPATAYATVQLAALGFSPVQGGESGEWVRLERHGEPTPERKDFEAGLADVLAHPSLDLTAPDGDLAACRAAWLERGRALDPVEFHRWADRFWLVNMIGAASPVFLSRSQVRGWREVSERVLRRIHQEVQRVAADPDLQWHLLGHRRPVGTAFPLVARFDGSQQPEGPVFFELNVGAIGFSDTDRTAAVYRRVGLDRGEATVYPLTSSLVTALQGHRARLGQDRWLAIPVAPAEEPIYAGGLSSYVRLLRAAGWPALYCPIRQLSYRDGELRTQDGRRIGLVARAYFPGSPGTEAVEQAVADGAVELLNPPSAHGDKGLFEVVEDPALPWTRVLCSRTTLGPQGQSIDLVPYALSEQAGLVLKPTDGYGGRHVLLGQNTAPEVWQRAVEEAVRDYPQGRRSIVQSVSPIPRESFLSKHGDPQVLHWDCNAFLFDGKFGGLAARLSPSAITNISLGGGTVPVYVV